MAPLPEPEPFRAAEPLRVPRPFRLSEPELPPAPEPLDVAPMRPEPLHAEPYGSSAFGPPPLRTDPPRPAPYRSESYPATTFRSSTAAPTPVGAVFAGSVPDGPGGTTAPLDVIGDVTDPRPVDGSADGSAAARIPMPRAGRAASRAGRPAPAHHAAAPADAGRLLPVVTAVYAVLAITLTGVALYAADRLPGTSRTLALAGAGIAAVCAAATVAVLLARLATAAGSRGRARRPAHGSLTGVAATVPGVLLAVSLGLVGAAAAVAVTATGPVTPRLSVGTERNEDGSRLVRVDATVGGLAEGEPIAVSLSAVNDGTTLLSSAVRRAGGTATDTVQLSGTVVDARSVQVDVSLTGRLCRAVVPVRAVVSAEDALVTCRLR